MGKKFFLLICVLIFLLVLVVYMIYVNKSSNQLEFNPPYKGIVPDEITAIKIAEAIGQPIFGKNLKAYKPFHASLKNDSIWLIYGLPKKSLFYVQLGGCPNFEIQKKDGKLLKVFISR